MRARSLPLALAFGLSLACASADVPTDATPGPSAEPHWPVVGEPAPPLSLETLTGSRVVLPMSDADRAAVLIFGSFS